MQIVESISEWQTIRRQQINQNMTVGFVPTLGNLHAGHRSLLERSCQDNEITVLSIFINPTQFNNPSDLQNYPRTLEQDKALAEQVGVDYVFLPNYQELYPDAYTYKITETSLSSILEGVYRPNHFDGVLTVVMKLLMLVKPTRAYFGEKDYQQLELIKGLVSAFFLETEIIACPTIRNEFGLPLSSRNNRLSAEQYQRAQNFPNVFHSAQNCEVIKKQLMQHGFRVDYIEDYQNRRLAAVYIDDIRLIDNIILAKGADSC